MDAPEAGLGLIDHRLHVVLAGDVGFQEEALRAHRLDLGPEALAVRLAQARGHDLGSRLGEGQGGRSPDARRGADDDHGAIVEVQDGHAALPLCLSLQDHSASFETPAMRAP